MPQLLYGAMHADSDLTLVNARCAKYTNRAQSSPQLFLAEWNNELNSFITLDFFNGLFTLGKAMTIAGSMEVLECKTTLASYSWPL